MDCAIASIAERAGRNKASGGSVGTVRLGRRRPLSGPRGPNALPERKELLPQGMHLLPDLPGKLRIRYSDSENTVEAVPQQP